MLGFRHMALGFLSHTTTNMWTLPSPSSPTLTRRRYKYSQNRLLDQASVLLIPILHTLSTTKSLGAPALNQYVKKEEQQPRFSWAGGGTEECLSSRPLPARCQKNDGRLLLLLGGLEKNPSLTDPLLQKKKNKKRRVRRWYPFLFLCYARHKFWIFFIINILVEFTFLVPSFSFNIFLFFSPSYGAKVSSVY